jgi:hypothetical protein
MTKLTTNDKITLSSLFHDGLIDRIIDDIRQTLALEIIETPLDDYNNREDLYNLTKALKELKGKLQECANDFQGDEQ